MALVSNIYIFPFLEKELDLPLLELGNDFAIVSQTNDKLGMDASLTKCSGESQMKTLCVGNLSRLEINDHLISYTNIPNWYHHLHAICFILLPVFQNCPF